MSASSQAVAAVNAAKNCAKWGEFATLRFCEKRGVSKRMFRAAYFFEQRRAIRRAVKPLAGWFA